MAKGPPPWWDTIWHNIPEIITGAGTIQPQIGEVQQGSQNVGTAVSDAASVSDFLGRLTQGNLWLRVGEFAVGAILLYVGLRAMFPTEVGAITGPVKTAAKVGALAA